MTEEKNSISDLILEFFRKNAKKDMPHGPVVDYVEERYFKLYAKKPRDIWRQIRRLHQEGILIKVKKGIYRYDPHLVQKRELYEFPQDVKEEIFKRDNYKCVVCGRGREDGMEIHADHRITLDKSGTNTLENGQTLCSEHNVLKKNYSQTEFGKKFIIKLYKEALKNNDSRMIQFCKEILDVYDKHKVNGHIRREDDA